jgi:hypothetical protein
MASAAKKINKSDMTTPKGDEGGGAREKPSSKGPHAPYMQRSGPAEHDMGEWKGGYSDDKWLGNTADPKARQFASEGAGGYFGGCNIAYPQNDPDAELYMVPDFMEQSGQGANQSTLRPIGSV